MIIRLKAVSGRVDSNVEASINTIKNPVKKA
jgi:hypothetical protein